jgi:sugar O-acyltransferase (sialic acid O-acetyltransferase NeuD family)
MKDIVIYGMGGLGREVAIMIAEINAVSPQWNFIGFIDDSDPETITPSSFGKHLGGIDVLNNWPTDLCVALCFGNPGATQFVKNKITNPKVSFPNIIHPSLYIGDKQTCTIGEGNIISGSCCMSCNITIGNFNLLNGWVVIGHDTVIGDFNIIMPGSRISGKVKVGNNNLFGAMSFIKQQLTIGDGVTVGPLSALLTKPKSGCTYIGNPAKIFRY